MTVRTLLVLRHAKSDWSAPDLPDVDRPLADKGRKQLRRLVRHLRAESSPSPVAVVTSPARRARDTAAPVAEALDAATVVDERIYEAPAAALLGAVRDLPPEAATVVLVGHMPGLAELLEVLTGEFHDLPTCALAVVELDVPTWAEAAPATGRLVRVVTPKELRAAEAADEESAPRPKPVKGKRRKR